MIEYLYLNGSVGGGGGSPTHTFLQCRELLRQGHEIKVIDLKDMSPECLVGWGGGLGTPEVSFGLIDVRKSAMLTQLPYPTGRKRAHAGRRVRQSVLFNDGDNNGDRWLTFSLGTTKLSRY